MAARLLMLSVMGASILCIRRIMYGRIGLAAVMPITKLAIDHVKKWPPWGGRMVALGDGYGMR
jgi:uncharacterized membrane protein YuzA (DUF378 family)